MTDRGVVAAGSPHVARAGASLLAAGGNAVDAAVAACFATTMAEPMLSSVGAAGVMVIRTPDGSARVLDFFADAPSAWQGGLGGEPVRLQFGAGTVSLELGAGAAAVPGFVPGLVEAITRFGALGLRDAVGPAVALGREGVLVDAWLAQTLEVTEPVVRWSNESRARFVPGGELLPQGVRLHSPRLADFLEELGRSGIDAYASLAHAMAEGFGAKAGGHLRIEDFERYQVIEREPAMLRYRGATVLCVPDPGSAHRVLGPTLAALEEHAPEREWTMDALRVALEAAAIKAPEGPGHTTHVSVIDGDGMAVAVTVSHGAGAGLLVPGTESMMNGILGEEHVRAHSAGVGGTRLSTMMCPTIALWDGAVAALGTGGSERIPSLVAQVLCRLVDGQAPADAVRAPRVYVHPTAVYVEGPRPEPSGARAGPPIVGLGGSHAFFGGVQLALRDPDGRLDGAGDVRRGGALALA